MSRKVGEVEMSYQSPIEVIQSQMRSQIEGEIYRAVMNVGVNVDKDELLKALQYDRGQYQKGYEDRDSQVVRCKDCQFYNEGRNEVDAWMQCRLHSMNTSPDEFCSWAVKKN